MWHPLPQKLKQCPSISWAYWLLTAQLSVLFLGVVLALLFPDLYLLALSDDGALLLLLGLFPLALSLCP